MKNTKSNFNTPTIELKELLFFSIERIIMTKNHLDGINNYILRRDRDDWQTPVYTECLKKILKGIIHNVNSYLYAITNKKKEDAFNILYSLFGSIKKLQIEFNLLPKEDAPIEIHRFLRIFHRDGLSISGSKNSNVKHVLYISEQNSTSTFDSSPLAEFEEKHLNSFLDGIDFNNKSKDEQAKDLPYHIIVPRIETNAPLYWPTLAHEIAHQIMDLGFFEIGKITQDWANQFGSLKEDAFGKAFQKMKNEISSKADEDNIIESWLTECWCDLYAYFAVGPAFIFAQKGTFLFNRYDSKHIGDEKHPPSFLRLTLLFLFAKRHQEDLLKEYDSLGELLTLYPADKLLPHDEDLKKSLIDVTARFYEFFNYYFDLEKNRQRELNSHLKKLKEHSVIYNKERFQILIKRLNANYPVPSLITDKENLIEKETTVQEVMLAAWLSYEKTVKIKTIDSIFGKFEELNKYDFDQLWNYFCRKIVPIFGRFNESVLRSLQIGEWVKLLKPQPQSPISEENPKENSKSRFCVSCHECEPSLLVDHEIKELIQNDSLKIIPLIDVSAQLGACSLDIRLGPSFQTYQPNQSGVVDLTDEESVKNVFKNSTDIDLDFMEAIVLAPGQFVLAHTMEYVGLPENVAAQIEGRSSFARLGLQVHMTANLIDPGFHGSITFELFNTGPNPIRLYPGYRIGQLRFFKSKQPLNPYNIKKGAKFKGMFIHSTSLLDKKDAEVEKIAEKLKQMREANKGSSD